jgi:outer membrane protein OmpA-like peptidoglycan-associated protein
MRASLPIFSVLLALSSCGSPPKPPTVDESRKHPVNSAQAVELQVCKTDLQNTRLLASETTRFAESASATATRLALQQQVLTSRTAALEVGNSVYSVRFDFGSSEVAIPASDKTALIEHARAAAFLMLRGRTDGSVESAAESRIARDRALAVRTLLVQSGIEPTKIRATWQAVGDAAGDNDTPIGRTLNRRVEIELYRVAPQTLTLNVGAAS